MAREAFDRILEGLTDAIAYAQGDETRGAARVPDTDVATVRKQLGLSQRKFADLFGISAGTVRNWEQGVREPEGPARVLLAVIAKEPDAVLRALHTEDARHDNAMPVAG